MGYITDFQLVCIGPEEEIAKFHKSLLAHVKEADDEYEEEITDLIESGSTYGKLYDLEDWVYTVAKRYPEVLVILKGNGEEGGDLWEMRVKGNEFEKNYASIPPFTNINLILPSDKQ